MVFLWKVWAWIKKYWKYLLFPVGIVLGILAVIFKRKDLGKVVAPKEVETEGERDTANAEAKKKAEDAAKAKKKAIQHIVMEHADTIGELTQEQLEKVGELEGDPDALNEFLLGVGKEIRG